ncbi:MAG: carbohydrate binding family 9 domain-containing protein [Steroidobacteraceae bacterium]|nr:carbohydrate binding family 9 domain-containing protein [Steroidobacteraceae bacterium]
MSRTWSLLAVGLITMIPLGLRAAQSAPAAFPMGDFGATAAVHIDGLLDPAWQNVPALGDFQEYRPREGVPATVRTEVRFARDATYFYVYARMFDPDIARLRSGLARRDNFSNEQDWISIALDPLGTRRVAQLFYFNADGVVWDGLSNEDTGTATAAADFELEIATHVDAESWSVELRIPFDEIRYASRNPDAWHVLVRRNYPREERHAMAAPAIPASAPCFMCLAAPLHPPGELPAPQSLTLVPQVLALGRETEPSGDRTSDLEPSLDVKWRLSPATVLDAAINPDFSQVDLDTPQLSSNRQFAVSFPEKRPFFLEGIDILDSPLAAIYTRSITDPAWGARGTHRGGWDGALLTLRDDGGGYTVLPGPFSARFLPQSAGSQATVARVRAPIGAVTLGGVLTDRRAGDGFNTVAGPDVSWRVSPNTRISTQFLASRTRGDAAFPGPADESSGNAATVDVLHEGTRWRGALTLSRLDENFRADNGFIPQTGIESFVGEVRRKFTGLPHLAELAPYITLDSRDALAGGRVSRAPRVGAQTTFANNVVLVTEWRPRETVRTRAGGELHRYSQGYVSLTAYPGSRLPVLTLSAIVGEAVDFSRDRAGRGETVSASVLWRPVNRLEIQPSVDITRVRTAAEFQPAQESRESAAQLLTTLHLSARGRFRLIAQKIDSGDAEQFVGSLLFTHERSLTRRLYAGIAFARSEEPGEPPSETREVFVKWQWGFSSAQGFRMF